MTLSKAFYIEKNVIFLDVKMMLTWEIYDCRRRRFTSCRIWGNIIAFIHPDCTLSYFLQQFFCHHIGSRLAIYTYHAFCTFWSTTNGITDIIHFKTYCIFTILRYLILSENDHATLLSLSFNWSTTRYYPRSPMFCTTNLVSASGTMPLISGRKRRRHANWSTPASSYIIKPWFLDDWFYFHHGKPNGQRSLILTVVIRHYIHAIIS